MFDAKSVLSISPDAKVAIIAAMLKHPDDLSNLSAIRQKLIREKAIVDQQLKIGVQNQMEETKEALDILGTTKEQVLGIRSNMKNIDSLCKDAQGLIKDYPRIRKVTQCPLLILSVLWLIDLLLSPPNSLSTCSLGH